MGVCQSLSCPLEHQEEREACLAVLSGRQVAGQVFPRPAQQGLPFFGTSCCWDAFQVEHCLELGSWGTGLSEMVCGPQVRNDRWSPDQSLLERSLKTPNPREKACVSCEVGVLTAEKKGGLQAQSPRCSGSQQSQTSREAVAGPPVGRERSQEGEGGWALRPATDP